MADKFQVSYNGVDYKQPFESLAEALCAKPRSTKWEANIHKLRPDGKVIWMAYAVGEYDDERHWELTSTGLVEARK
jgi:hypothetical protein